MFLCYYRIYERELWQIQNNCLVKLVQNTGREVLTYRVYLMRWEIVFPLPLWHHLQCTRWTMRQWSLKCVACGAVLMRWQIRWKYGMTAKMSDSRLPYLLQCRYCQYCKRLNITFLMTLFFICCINGVSLKKSLNVSLKKFNFDTKGYSMPFLWWKKFFRL